MGFFSWYTQDTGESIANNYSSRPTFTVFMVDDKGNKWREDDYEGYGVFGGKDYFQLLAEMNGIAIGDLDKDRDAGIDLTFKDSPEGDNPNCKYPNLVEDPNWEWKNDYPESCPNQGYFYEDEDEDEEEWYDVDDEA